MQRPNDKPTGQKRACMLDAEHLSDILPTILGRQVAVECCGRAHSVGRAASTRFDGSFARSNCRLYTRARTAKETGQATQKPWLIVFDPQKVVPLFSRMVAMTSRVV
jgi:hypothetical protein